MPAEKLDTAWPVILEKVSGGMAVATACKEEGIDRSAFYARVRSSSDLEREFATALADRGEVLADEIITLADEQPPDDLDPPGLTAWTARQRLRLDARKWSAAKLQPKRYSETLSIENKHSVDMNFLRDLIQQRDLYLANAIDAVPFVEREQHVLIECEAPPSVALQLRACAHEETDLPDFLTAVPNPEGEPQ